MNKEELEDLLSIGCCKYHEEIGEKAKKEIERLHSIIKEVREYIDKYGILDLNGYDLLEILDKVGEE